MRAEPKDSTLERKYNVRTLQPRTNSPPISDDVDHPLGQAQESGQATGDEQDVEEERDGSKVYGGNALVVGICRSVVPTNFLNSRRKPSGHEFPANTSLPV